MTESFVLTYDHEQVLAENEQLRAAIEEASEATEILDNLIDSVRKHGNYSQEATLLFLSHARQCLNCLTKVRS
jgi:hypothetical protein